MGTSARRIAEADSVAVIGLGRFGSALALELMDTGTEVLGIDTDEDLVQSHNGQLTQVVRADATKEEVLRQLAVHEFDRVVVAIGHDIQSSILVCALLRHMEVPIIWAKSISEQHGRILEQLGVHHIVNPEQDMGRRVAHLVRGAAMDYLEIEPGYSLAKISAPPDYQGTALGATNLRQAHGVTVTAFKGKGDRWVNADNQTVLSPGDAILIVGPTDRVEAFAQLT
ncbi:potassium channel family protein [Microbacterium sp. P5_E9]